MNSESIFLISTDLHEYCKTNKNKKQNEKLFHIFIPNRMSLVPLYCTL